MKKETTLSVLKEIRELLKLQSLPTISGVRENSLKELIAEGNYDYVNREITEKNFPEKEYVSDVNKYKLFYFNKYITSEEAIKEMGEMYRPATLKELLTFGIANPELQREFPIIALGSVWVHRFGYRRVPCLDGSSDERRLRLSWYGGDWHGRCRFLGVGK